MLVQDLKDGNLNKFKGMIEIMYENKKAGEVNLSTTFIPDSGQKID